MKNVPSYRAHKVKLLTKTRNKSAILKFVQPLLNLSKNYLLVTCIKNLKRIREKLFKLLRPQGQIIDVKCEKSQ